MRLPSRLWPGLAVSALALGVAVPAVRAQESTGPLPVDVVLNGRDMQRPALAVLQAGRLLVRIEDLRDLGIVTVFDADLLIEGERYLDVDGESGLSARLDPQGTALLLDVDPRHLPRRHVAAKERGVPVAAAVPVAFIDYDLNFSDQRGHTQASAVLDAGVSGAWGVIGSSALIDSQRTRVVRLDTAFVRDIPERNLRLAVGDTYTRASPWSQPARFGGIRFGTDFSLDPSLITYPVPSLAGSALLPSTVELASRSSRQSLSVEPGRFAFDYRPRFTGAGEVTMIVRDLAGTERTVTRSFYSSTALLRPDISEFSLEAGALRQDYGWSSLSYGAPFVAASYRRGLSTVVTLEGRAEADAATRMAGAGLTWVIQPLGELRVDAAGSQGEAGWGGLYQVQFQRLAPGYSVTASYRGAGAGFRQVGDLRRGRAATRELAISGSIVMGRFGGFNASYLRSEEGKIRRSIASAGYSVNLGLAFLSIGAQRFDRGDGTDMSVFGSLTLPLGGRRHAGFFADNDRMAATFEKVAPAGTGLGYRAAVGRETGRGAWFEGAATLRSSAGQLDMAATRRSGAVMTRVEARGALVATGGLLMATPSVDDGLAIVEVPGGERIPVFLENQPVAARAGGGRPAIVTGLQPYVANRISVDPEALPITGELGGVEQVVAPGWRQAARVVFGAREVHPARLRLVDENGSTLPPGLAVSLGSGEEPTVTGYDGEVFLNDFEPGAALVVQRSGVTACRAVLPAAMVQDPLARATQVICRSYSTESHK